MGTYILIDEKKLAPAPGRKVIKAEEYATWLEAQELITQAKQEAERIRSQAENEAATIRGKAYQDGLARGRAAMARQMLEMISQTSVYLQDFEDRIVATVLLSVRKIIGELPDREQMARVVRQALGVMRQQQRVTVRVAPSQEEQISQQVSTLLTAWPTIRHLDVVPDINLRPGTCLLESELGLVEASVEGQLEVLEKVMSQAFGRREDAVSAQMERMKQKMTSAQRQQRKEEVA